MSNPQDPYGQPDPYGQQQGPPSYEQPAQYPQQGFQYGQPGYQQPSGGYAPPKAPRKPIDLGTLVTIAAWVVLGLFVLKFLYTLTLDGDFGDLFFGGMSELGTGVFYAGVLLAVGVWLRRQQAGTD
jgi:hypothetical protein